MKKFVPGQILTADQMNEIYSGLLRSGAIELPAVTDETKEWSVDKSAIEALVDKSEAYGWCAFTRTGDVIEFAEELPAGATLIGLVFRVDEGEELVVRIVAPSYTGGATRTQDEWGLYIDDAYSSNVGVYDAECNRLDTDPDATPEGASFTIRRTDSYDFSSDGDSGSAFEAAFGTATDAQRTIAMHKLHNFPAADDCFNYNPAADVINMHGMWRLPNPKELGIDMYADGSNEALLGKMAELAVGFLYNGNYWSSLESGGDSAWGGSPTGGDTDGSNKNNWGCIRPVVSL